MAVYRFSALRDGQTVAFRPTSDFLNFDQSIISAADLRVTASGPHTHVEVISGSQAGKDIYLLNTTPLQLATSNVGFANGSRLLFGDDSPSQAGDNGDNLLNGSGGHDLIAGFGGNDALNGRAGNDTLSGGAGDDEFLMSTGGTASYGNDSIDGGEGADTVDFGANARSAVAADLGAGTLSGGGSGGSGSATLASIENLIGGAFNDRLAGSDVANNFYGGSGNDTLTGAEGNDTLRGADGSDVLQGGFAFATSGNPTGNDVLVGGAGRDFFVFNDSPNPFIAPPSATADVVQDFVHGTDELVFDDNVFPAAGPPGAYIAGDGRFYSARGAVSGHDASDRIVYDTLTGDLYYDPDGNGAQAAQIIANLPNHAPLTATDITVI